MSIISNNMGHSRRNLKAYFTISFSFILVFTLLRIIDFVNVYNHSEILMSFADLGSTIVLDFMLAMAFSGLGFVLYMLFTLVSFRLAKVVIYALFSVIIIAYISFIEYFSQGLVPLDQVVFIYDFSDIVDIAFGSGNIGFWEIFTFMASIAVFFISDFILSKIRISRYLIGFFIFLIIGSAAATNVFILSPTRFDNELKYYCNANKFIYFVKAVSKYEETDEDLNVKQIADLAAKYRKLDLSGKKYGSRTYPFSYNNDYKSTLASYFEPLPDGEKPNIVFIVVESLSPTVSGKYSPYHSFTPFLDSLAEQSLYWRNCLSTSERTFGVMPALMGSLIPGKKGFMEEKPPYENFLALPKVLKKNAYATQMFYGGWTGFTNMDKFVNAAGVDSIYSDFVGYNKMPKTANGHTWGYGDNVLFKASDKYINSDTVYFSLYLTLSTHMPFESSDHEYMKAYTDSVIESLLDEAFKKKAVKFADGLKSFVVLDNEIRLFIKRYKKRPEYRKTIFVITGDHNGILFETRSSLDKYYVPLIIYSPLLNSHHEFGGMVTHNDVFPSIQNLLYNRYGLKVNRVEHSIGCQLDTSIAFNANNMLFPMRNSRDMIEFVYKDYYLANGRLFQIYDNMEVKPVDNTEVRNRMQQQLDDYLKLQNSVLMTNSLLSPMDILLEENNK